MLRILAGYLVLLNLTGLAVMVIDKRNARHRAWRIPEKTLLILAAIGGAAGLLTGMHVFRHKTRKIKFLLGVPVILCLQITLIFLLSRYLP